MCNEKPASYLFVCEKLVVSQLTNVSYSGPTILHLLMVTLVFKYRHLLWYGYFNEVLTAFVMK